MNGLRIVAAAGVLVVMSIGIGVAQEPTGSAGHASKEGQMFSVLANSNAKPVPPPPPPPPTTTTTTKTMSLEKY